MNKNYETPSIEIIIYESEILTVGRIIKVPQKDTVVSYTITLTDKSTGVSNSVTYFSTIPGSK